MALCVACVAASGPPPLPKPPAPKKPVLLSPRQAQVVRASAPRSSVVNLSVVIGDGVPAGARGYILEISTNEFGISSEGSEIRLFDPFSSFPLSITNEFRKRPERFFFSMATLGRTGNSGYVMFHWPLFPRVPCGMALSWGEVLPVTIEVSEDLQNWTTLTNVVSDHFDHIPDYMSDQFFYRASASKPLVLSSSLITKPDIRDDYK